MPWRLFPWTRLAHQEDEEAAREADRALSVMAALNERLRESRDRIVVLAARLEAENGRHRPEHT